MSEFINDWGPDILLAVAVLFIGAIIIRYAKKGLASVLERNKVEVTAAKFVGSVVGAILWVIVFITILGVFGVPTTSFIAVLGAFGLALGLALQDSLANFAGGVMLLIYKPFVAGEYIAAQGAEGEVIDVQIAATTIKAPDGKLVIIPNGQISSDVIVNYTREGTRRVEVAIGIGYDDDIRLAKQIMEEKAASDDRVLADPDPQVIVSNLGDSAVEISVRAWVKTDDYWPTHFDWTEDLKLAYDAAGLSIPFPQRDVHLHKTE